jgi:hypothetical protein
MKEEIPMSNPVYELLHRPGDNEVQPLDAERIRVRLIYTEVHTRWPCTVCGGHTNKVGVLAEAKVVDGAGTKGTIRVCENCLVYIELGGDIDAELERTAADMEKHARHLRSLVGRLEVPSFAEWNAAPMDEMQVGEAAT